MKVKSPIQLLKESKKKGLMLIGKIKDTNQLLIIDIWAQEWIKFDLDSPDIITIGDISEQLAEMSEVEIV